MAAHVTLSRLSGGNIRHSFARNDHILYYQKRPIFGCKLTSSASMNGRNHAKKTTKLRFGFVSLARIRGPIQAGYNTTKRCGVTSFPQSHQTPVNSHQVIKSKHNFGCASQKSHIEPPYNLVKRSASTSELSVFRSDIVWLYLTSYHQGAVS